MKKTLNKYQNDPDYRRMTKEEIYDLFNSEFMEADKLRIEIYELEDMISYLKDSYKQLHEFYMTVAKLIINEDYTIKPELSGLMEKIISRQNQIIREINSTITRYGAKKVIPVSELMNKVKLN